MDVVNINAIPYALRRHPQWVLWRWEERTNSNTGEVKRTKPPYQRNGQKAESDNHNTWDTFDRVFRAYKKGGFAGIGIVVTKMDDLAGVDLDHCRDPDTETIEPWAKEIVDKLNSYTEISPSGTGLRIFMEAKLPPKDRKIGNFECYDNGRYLTVTGNRLPGTSSCVQHRGKEMAAVHARMFKDRNSGKQSGKANAARSLPNLDDQVILEKAFSAKNGNAVWRLFRGDISGHGSHSEADMALCSHLAFYAGPDPQKIDRLYRSSDLASPKWDDPRGDTTWGQMTIAKVLEGKTEFYSPNGHHTNGSDPSVSCVGSISGVLEENFFVEQKEWPELGSLPEEPSAPSLPADMIPPALRPWIEDIARQGCFPLEMVAAPALVAVGAVIGRKLAIRPWLFSDYTVVPNLWGCIVARPASMKSYAIEQAIRPLKRLAATAHDRFQAEVAQGTAHLLMLDAEIEGLKARMRQVAKKGESMGHLEDQVARKLQEQEGARPVERRYWVSDSTPEKLADLLKDNPQGLLVSYDELAGWLGEMEKQGREGSRTFYLAAWEGSGDHYVDRIQRGSNYLPAVCLSVIGGIQPDRLKRHIDEALSGGSGGDGMLQRLQVMICVDNLGEWKSPDRWPDTTAREAAYSVFKWLDETDLGSLGTKANDDDIPYLRFTPEAQRVADQWRDELEIRLRGNEYKQSPAFEAHLGKYRSLMPSLALIFHLLKTSVSSVGLISGVSEEKNSAVSLDDIELAADWCDYLEAHARVVYQAEVSAGVGAARKLAEKIQSGHIRDGEPVRDIYRHEWSGLATSRQVNAGLEVLETAGWVQVVSQATRGAPITVVNLHPDLTGSTE